MFVLHSSNKTENLVAHLAAVIEASPLSSPFHQEVFLIQSQGMERWLAQRLADHFGIFGNYQFLFPNRFFGAMAQTIDNRIDDSIFERDVMVWRIEKLLRDSLDEESDDVDDISQLRHYLSGENAPLKRYQLARQLAQIFDQYQLLRPDMLDEWQRGRLLFDSKTERWQKALWLKISSATGPKHRGALWRETIARLHAAEPGALSDLLPERIAVFGLNTMPPLFLNYLESLSKHCQVHFFLLNPAQSFWADLAGKRQSGFGELNDGHPLLAMLGQQGREFQEMLLEQVRFDFEPESFEPAAMPNNLQQLQNDILTNTPEPRTLIDDGSIAIHACHSRMREVEVLKDQLLQALETDPQLELRDIVVMAPDIQLYEPFIAAVFNDIQHAVADRGLRLSNGSLDAFIRFLNVSQSRFGRQSVLDLLEHPAICPAFGFSETDVALIKHWIQETHVRWGKSAAQRRELGLPEFDANTWQAMLDRLLMGYAVGSDDDFVDGLLPYKDIEGSSASALGGLCAFLRLLFDAGNDFKQPKPLRDWSLTLSRYAEQLLGPAETGERQQLNELLADLAADLVVDPALPFGVRHNEAVEWQVIIAWLEDRVYERKSAKGFLRGQLTFCSMLPMRSIPFKVIALMGMNEGEFPKMDRAPTFDLLAQQFRKGDRSRRADDRYQFLEILLSARRQLIMTYIGQSIVNNQATPPSVVVNELLDVLRQNYQLSDLIVLHPLQAFSPRYFDGTPPLFSYSETNCNTAVALSAAKPASALWWQGEIPVTPHDSAEPEQVIELDDLFDFFRHPQRHFLRRQLDLHFTGVEMEPEEREPFTIAGLDGYAIYHEWIGRILNGADFPLKKLQAQGRWLPCAPGELEYARLQPIMQDFVERIKIKNLGHALDSLPVDLKIEQYRVIGKLTHRYQNGSLFYRFADLKGKDFVNAWLHHLIINREQPRSTYLISTDKDLLIKPDYCRDHYLSALLDIYADGLRSPDAFFTEAAFAYVQQALDLKNGGKSGKPALEKAIDQLTDSVSRPYEPELNRLYDTIADFGQVLGGTFERYCQMLLMPVWEAMHGH